MNNQLSVTIRGLIFPPLRLSGRSFQMAVYADCCRGEFTPAGPWRFREGSTWTAGFDAGDWRFRVVVEKLRPGGRCEWGLC